jgi:hypothetical protein
MKFNVTVKMMVGATRKTIALKIIRNEISKIPIKVNQLRVEEYRDKKLVSEAYRAVNLGFALPYRHMLYHATVDMTIEATTDEHARQIVCTDKTLFAEVLASDITITRSNP